MPHVVLLGDSIFDNGRYVPGKPAVIDQLRSALPADWYATLLAVDGHITRHVAGQLSQLPTDATHLIVSVGGNDALGVRHLLSRPGTAAQTFAALQHAYDDFRVNYESMLKVVKSTRLPAAVCTIYDAVPGLGSAERAALAGFNDVITRAAFAARMALIDLRLTCDEPADYSPLSPIEPSHIGGAKIVKAIVRLLTSSAAATSFVFV